MKQLKQILVLISVLISLSQANYAAEFPKGEIARIYPNGNKVYFRLKNDTCLSGNQYYYFVMSEIDDVGKYASRNWYSMLLASAMAGKPITVRLATCPTEGNAQITYIFQDY